MKLATKLKTLAAIALTSLNVGCGTPMIRVIYDSNPKFASAYSLQGQYLGVCPVKIRYVAPNNYMDKPFIPVDGIRVRWISGAEATYSRINAQPTAIVDQTFTIQRPTDYPRFELDLMNAMQRENAELRKEEIDVQKSHNSGSILDNMIKMQRATEYNNRLNR